MNSTLEAIPTGVELWKAEDVLGWAFQHFEQEVALASGFGAEGMVLIDMAWRLRSDFQLFTLDTGLLFAETYALMEQVEQRYGVRIERCGSKLSPEAQERTYGAALWTRQPDQCASKGRAADEKACRAEGLDRSGSPRPDECPRGHAQGRLGWQIRFGEGQSAGRLDLGTSLAVHPVARRAIQSTPRPELPQYRLYPLHAAR